MFYTGAGDDGMTKTFGCNQQKISKSSEVLEALGALDELNSFLGFVKVRAAGVAGSAEVANVVREAQENLFIIQAEVAGADKKIGKEGLERAENMIGDIEKEVPPIKGFSVAGGTELSALLDVARTLARRAERRLVALNEMDKSDLSKISGETLAYMNRLSSLLFALARLANHRAGIAGETPRY